MTTKVYIKRGCLWLNGQLFQSGNIVEVDNRTAAKLKEDKINQFVVGDVPTAPIAPEVKTNKANKVENNGDISATLPLPDDLAGKSK